MISADKAKKETEKFLKIDYVMIHLHDFINNKGIYKGVFSLDLRDFEEFSLLTEKHFIALVDLGYKILGTTINWG